MGPRDFHKTVVLPDFRDFQANDTDIRAAYHAVTSTDALAAQIYWWCKQNNVGAISGIDDDSHYRGELAKHDSDFGLLRDIANAQKHVFLVKPKKRKPQISGADGVSVRQLGWKDEPRWDEAKWDSPAQIVVRTKRGDNRVVLNLVEHGLNMLESEMKVLSVP